MAETRVTYSVKEVAAKTGLSLAGVYQLVTRGEIPGIRAGKRWLIPASWVDGLDPSAPIPQPSRPADDQPRSAAS